MMEIMSSIKIAFISHRGKVREANEDCIGVVDALTLSDLGSVHLMESRPEAPSIVMVADGLGGHVGGRFASGFVSRRLLALARDLKDGDDLGAAINATNKALYDEMAANPDFSRMGATIAGVLLSPDCLYGFNVGDSRIYELVPGPYLRLLSIDDVPKTPDYDVSARTGQTSHVVTQCLGGTSRITDVEPHIVARPIVSGSVFLMCSDGLTDMLDQDAIEDCIDADIAVFARRLFDQAMAAGGVDNISICVLEIN
jgi:protein phosphatase